jgi:DNA-binding transcriptional LysR family regulator
MALGWRMLDGVSLDQLRTFIAAVDEGSFSAAARKLLRAYSVVSETVSNLEDQIGVPHFDRSGCYPKLTPAGVVLLADARSIVTGVDLLKARAKGMAVGLEPELSVVADVFITQVGRDAAPRRADGLGGRTSQGSFHRGHPTG